MNRKDLPRFEKERRFTTAQLFNETIAIIRKYYFTDERKDSIFDGKLTLDYITSCDYEYYSKKNISDYEYNVESIANYGGSEGIYIDVSLRGYVFKEDRKAKEEKKYHIATLKTLAEDIEAMRACGELAGLITAVMTNIINLNIDCFEE